jgi:hypothetical protein
MAYADGTAVAEAVGPVLPQHPLDLRPRSLDRYRIGNREDWKLYKLRGADWLARLLTYAHKLEPYRGTGRLLAWLDGDVREFNRKK